MQDTVVQSQASLKSSVRWLNQRQSQVKNGWSQQL